MKSPALSKATEIDLTPKVESDWIEFGVFENSVIPLVFAIRNSDKTFQILKANSIGALLLAASGISNLEYVHCSTEAFTEEKMNWALSEAVNSEYLVPKHQSGITTKNLAINPYCPINLDGMGYRYLGRVRGPKIES